MLKFTVEIRVMADKPKDEEMKNIFMKNAQDVIQRGLEAMTVPDWTVSVIELEEEDD